MSKATSSPSILMFFTALPATKSVPVLGSTAAESAALICCSVRLMKTPVWGCHREYPTNFVQYTPNQKRESGLLHRIQTVALSVHRRQHQPAFAGQPKLLAQTAGMSVDGTGIHSRLLRPNTGQQLFTRQHAADVAQQDDRQFELALGQLDIQAAQSDPPPLKIDFDTAKLQRAWARFPTAQQGLHPRQKLHVANRLRDKIVGSETKNICRGLFIGAAGTEKDRHIPATMFPHLFQNLVTTDVRQIPVNHEKVEAAALECLDAKPAFCK